MRWFAEGDTLAAMKTPILPLVAACALVSVCGSAFAQRGPGVDALWNNNCAKCHGDDAQGGGAGTRTLLTAEQFDQKYDREFFDKIKNGVPEAGMEAFGETMTDAQMWGMVVYIREKQAQFLRSQTGSPKPGAEGVYKSQRHNFKVETIISKGLDVPWAVDWLPDGGMLVTNRNGRMQLHKNGTLGDAIDGMPTVRNRGQGGLMDVTVHPDYATNGWIYIAYSDPYTPDGGSRSLGMTKIVRGKLKTEGEKTSWVDQQTIFEARKSDYVPTDLHFGCRVVFDPKDKGRIFFAIGERGMGPLAQDLAKPNGKVFRVNEDGTVPADNPFNTPEHAAKDVYPQIWSYGHRNPQGLAFDAAGNLWDTEHGPRGGDEVNLVKKGANYGWPAICFSINYNGAVLSTPWQAEPKAGEDPGVRYEMPVFRWLPSIGACGLDVMLPRTTGKSAFPQWEGDLFAGGLSGANVDRLRIKDGKLVEREEIIHNMGRVRDVMCGPDGFVYVVLNGPDRVIRIVPAS